MSFINTIKEKKYKWNFVNVGGSARVRINSGEDIAHLDELDPKMWTVLRVLFLQLTHVLHCSEV